MAPEGARLLEMPLWGQPLAIASPTYFGRMAGYHKKKKREARAGEKPTCEKPKLSKKYSFLVYR